MAAADIEYRILGPLEAAVDGRPAALGGRIQRGFLGALLLRANEPLSADRLVDAVWGGAPPSTALHAVSVYVSKLRKALGADAIAHTPAGYILRVAPGRLDLERFEALVWEARENLVAGEPGRACELLDEALSLWRGPALVDAELEDFARADVTRLEELRLGAATSRAEALLALARAGEALPELDALAAEHPHDERLAGLLILALYRAGRQGAALAHYQATRLRLAADLGIEPSQALQELEQKILTQEPSLSLEPEEIEQVRSVVALPRRLGDLTALAELTEPFALSRNPHEVILGWIAPPEPADEVSPGLAEAHTQLAGLRTRLVERGGRARVAAFTTEDRAADILRLAGRTNVDLLLLGSELTDLEDDGRFRPELTRILGGAQCDVALWFERRVDTVARDGPILVPFGALEHDWAALELAGWIATTTGRPLALLGAAADSIGDRRDASRMLADAGLLIQGASGVVPEPRLVAPGRAGLLDATEDAGLVVSGLSERWAAEGLGATRLELARAARSHVLFIRRGQRPSGLSPVESLTLYRWSMTVAAR